MDAQKLLDELLSSGQELVAKGRMAVEEKLNIPEVGEQRDAMLAGMSKGALAVGTLALLLGTKGGRKLTSGALKIGSLAAVSGLAWKAFQDWQAKQPGSATENGSGRPISELDAPEAQLRSLLLLRAMITAAKSDGHISAVEQEKINALIEHLGIDSDVLGIMRREIANPVDVAALVASVDTIAEAAEVYLTSLMVIDEDSPVGRKYLNDLASALKLDADLVAELETNASDSSI